MPSISCSVVLSAARSFNEIFGFVVAATYFPSQLVGSKYRNHIPVDMAPFDCPSVYVCVMSSANAQYGLGLNVVVGLRRRIRLARFSYFHLVCATFKDCMPDFAVQPENVMTAPMRSTKGGNSW